jgi:hypothetical protein
MRYAKISILVLLLAITGCDMLAKNKTLPTPKQPAVDAQSKTDLDTVFYLMDLQNEFQNITWQIHATIITADAASAAASQTITVNDAFQTITIKDPSFGEAMILEEGDKRGESFETSIKKVDDTIQAITAAKLSDEQKEAITAISKKWTAIKDKLQHYLLSLDYCATDPDKVTNMSVELLDALKLLDDNVVSQLNQIRTTQPAKTNQAEQPEPPAKTNTPAKTNKAAPPAKPAQK